MQSQITRSALLQASAMDRHTSIERLPQQRGSITAATKKDPALRTDPSSDTSDTKS